MSIAIDQRASGVADGQHGPVVWLVGRPSSGKTTLASAIQRGLVRTGRPCVVLDGDAVRNTIVPRHDYSDAGRSAFYQTLAGFAGMLSSQGLIVVVAATAHRARYRAAARKLAHRFIEVYVDTPLAECVARDDKGLYRAAREGAISSLPVEDFDVPENPDLVAHGGHDGAALQRVLERLSP